MIEGGWTMNWAASSTSVVPGSGLRPTAGLCDVRLEFFGAFEPDSWETVGLHRVPSKLQGEAAECRFYLI